MNFSKIQEIIVGIACMLLFSFVFNFLWESLHGFSLFIDHVIDSDKYVRMMVHMSFMDALTILAMYAVCALFLKDVFWVREMNIKQGLIFAIVGIVVAVTAEYWAVYVTHEWHYNDQMPVLFGIGLSPLFQLSMTGVLSLWLTKKLIFVSPQG